MVLNARHAPLVPRRASRGPGFVFFPSGTVFGYVAPGPLHRLPLPGELVPCTAAWLTPLPPLGIFQMSPQRALFPPTHAFAPTLPLALPAPLPDFVVLTCCWLNIFIPPPPRQNTHSTRTGDSCPFCGVAYGRCSKERTSVGGLHERVRQGQ